MFRGHHRKVRIQFGLSDIALTALAFELAYIVRARMELEGHVFFLSPPVRILLMGWSMLVWVGLGYWWEIYDRIDAAHPRVILRDAFRQSLLGAASVVLFEFLLRLDLSRSFLGFFAVLAWVLLCLFRLSAGRVWRMLRREFGVPRFVMVVGVGPAARELGRRLEDAAPYGVRLIGFLAEPADGAAAEVELDGRYPVRPLAQLPDLLRQHVIDEIIFAVDSRRLSELEDGFLLCDEEGIRTRVAVDFFPHINSQVY